MQEVSGSSPLSPTTSIPRPSAATPRNGTFEPMSANPPAEAKELSSQLAQGAADDPYFEIRHSCAHVLAAALKRLFPGTRLGIGPPVEDGFYYDVQPPRPLTADDLPTIEAEMKKIVAEGQTFERTVLPIAEAK